MQLESRSCQPTHRAHQTYVQWGVENELVPPATYQGLAAVGGLRRGRSDARETEPVKPVPASDVAATLHFINRHVSAMVQVQLWSGMRPGEICVMAGAALDTSGKIWFYSPRSHKTAHHGHARKIAIGPRAQAILKPFLLDAGDSFLFSPRRAMEEYMSITGRSVAVACVTAGYFLSARTLTRLNAGLATLSALCLV